MSSPQHKPLTLEQREGICALIRRINLTITITRSLADPEAADLDRYCPYCEQRTEPRYSSPLNGATVDVVTWTYDLGQLTAIAPTATRDIELDLPPPCAHWCACCRLTLRTASTLVLPESEAVALRGALLDAGLGGAA